MLKSEVDSPDFNGVKKNIFYTQILQVSMFKGNDDENNDVQVLGGGCNQTKSANFSSVSAYECANIFSIFYFDFNRNCKGRSNFAGKWSQPKYRL